MSGVVPPAPQVSPGAPVLDGERSASTVAGRSVINRNVGAGLFVLAGAAAIGFILLSPDPPPTERAAGSERPQVRAWQVFKEPPPPPAPVTQAGVSNPFPVSPVTPQTTFTAPPPRPQERAPTPKQEDDPRASPILAFGSASGGAGATAAREDRSDTGSGPASPVKLTATPLAAVTANVLRDRAFSLFQGEQFPCVLQTAMDSTLPGQVSCLLHQDVRSEANVTLLDRGTRIHGEYEGGMQQGQERLFVMWKRARTPHGVVINLDSPAADPLGRAGFDGHVDRRTWERLEGALLLSIVQGALQAGTAAVSPQGSTNLNLGQTENVISDAFRGSVGIRPVLRKEQGAVVSIMLNKDISFRNVYDLRTIR